MGGLRRRISEVKRSGVEGRTGLRDLNCMESWRLKELIVHIEDLITREIERAQDSQMARKA